MLEISRAWSSALLLGSVVGAMLLGHSYLIAPAMSIQPLLRLVIWLWGSLAARATVAAVCLLLQETDGAEAARFSPGNYWAWVIGARWLVGLGVPAILAWMVWQSARIRSTQSATGILYAAVVLVFFGELVDEVLRG